MRDATGTRVDVAGRCCGRDSHPAGARTTDRSSSESREARTQKAQAPCDTGNAMKYVVVSGGTRPSPLRSAQWRRAQGCTGLTSAPRGRRDASTRAWARAPLLRSDDGCWPRTCRVPAARIAATRFERRVARSAVRHAGGAQRAYCIHPETDAASPRAVPAPTVRVQRRHASAQPSPPRVRTSDTLRDTSREHLAGPFVIAAAVAATVLDGWATAQV